MATLWTGYADQAPALPEAREFYRVTLMPKTIPYACTEDVETPEDVADRIRSSNFLGQTILKIERVAVEVTVTEVPADQFQTKKED